MKRDQKKEALRAADAAARVLRYFEKERPKDGRPRKAIEAARLWARHKMLFSEVRRAALAAHAAARDAKGMSAIAAARAAGHAAATAHMTAHAPHAIAYAAKAEAIAMKHPMKDAKKKAYTHRHADGSLWAKGFIVGGKMTGFWKWFRKDGSVMRTGHFEQGKQAGEWVTYDKKGKVVKVTKMK
jgi:hypothetical protein